MQLWPSDDDDDDDDDDHDDIILPRGAGWLLRWEFTRGLLSSIGYRRYLIDGLGEEEERG